MLAVRVVLPDGRPTRPPIVLVHGAANSARVWELWQRELTARGWASFAVDLRGHGESPAASLASTTMEDYAADVHTVVRHLPAPPVVMGWSMGGLVAMMAAARGGVVACVGLGPSTPAAARDAFVPLRTGTFGAEEYGITSRDPFDQPTMPDLDPPERAIALAALGEESRLARDERKAGIVLAALPCPTLIVAGSVDEVDPPSSYVALPVSADVIVADGASHWGLVLNGRALPRTAAAVVAWLEKRL